jgi:hypothetical protein
MPRQDNSETSQFELTARLDCRYRDALEQLLFFNANQPRVYRGAALAVERYGAPRISAENDRLWITLDSGIEAQSLFVVDQSQPESPLIGVIVYTRKDDVLVVLFMAVREDHAYRKDAPDKPLFRQLLDNVLEIARRVQGVAAIKLFLTDPPVTISVRR